MKHSAFESRVLFCDKNKKCKKRGPQFCELRSSSMNGLLLCLVGNTGPDFRGLWYYCDSVDTFAIYPGFLRVNLIDLISIDAEDIVAEYDEVRAVSRR